LLREWKVDVPASLEERVLGTRKPWWRLLISGYIRVPVPVALCLLLLTVAGVWRQSQLVRIESACAPAAPAHSSPCPANKKC